ncbi:MAG: aminotransferase class I/II-fold pyridoxal phosphate-dependent enzyme [Lachnospiraceae bacterium]|nr:aminotransferase class I/II-fold pyridoxal phosphate-dependent enzyme [Lachnospiraceae bacterium]
MTSLLDELKDYSGKGLYPCHMPGHKRHAFGHIPGDIAGIDLTEVEGADDLHDPSGIILEAERFAALQLGADESFFLINGSTAGILAAISACTDKGGRIVMIRNSHKSAYNAVYLRELDPVYIFPEVMETPCIVEAVRPEEVRKALDENPGVQAVFIVSPTYEGRLADIAAIADIVHERGIPLIVDEAHGAHLSFDEGNPSDAIRRGADIAVQSVHKTLPAPTQTAILSVKGGLVDRKKLRRFLSVYQSSSPSYPLMSMIDGCIRYMADNRELVPAFKHNFEKLLKRLEVCDKLIFRPFAEELRSGRADYGKLLICTDALGISGVRLAQLLREKYGIETEMTCPGYILAMFTVCDDKEGFERVADALIRLDLDPEICGKAEKSEKFPSGTGLPGHPQRVMLPSKAADSESEEIPLSASEGRICTGMVFIYPPGTPVLAPGERIEKEHTEYILNCISEGFNVKGIGDGCISVVKNG